MREFLKRGTLIRFSNGDYYKITGDEPIGEGGGSIIYSASRVSFDPASFACSTVSEIDYAIKECYPVSDHFSYRRNADGEIVPMVSGSEDHPGRSVPEHIAAEEEAGSESLQYLAVSKRMMLEETKISSAIYKKGFRLNPVLFGCEQCALSFDQGKTFHLTGNAMTVMEALHEKGASLKSILDEQKRIPFLQAAHITQQLLYALEEVHKAGYLYLDVQAGNVFVKGSLSERTDFVTLVDFGSARPVLEDGKTAPIADRVLFSTEGYTAPEMFLQNDGTLQLDCRADLYSVGYLFLYMITGKRYAAKELLGITDGKYLTGFRLKRLDCPKYLLPLLQEILSKTLCTDREERYGSTAEMQKDLQQLTDSLAPKADAISAVKYDAFICYKHGGTDTAAARQLQASLEHLSVPPKAYAGTDRHPIKRVFVDQGELSSCADFGQQIREALKNSRYLVVICSPETPSSKWVQLEIETFLEYHDRSRILAVITGGEPGKAFPEALKAGEDRDEVFAADARGGDLKTILQKIKKDVLYRIAAPMIGTTYDSFRQRRQTYFYKRAFGLSACGFLLLAGFLSFSLWQNNRIRLQNEKIQEQNDEIQERNDEILEQNVKIQEQYNETQKKQARLLAARAEDLLDEGDRAASIRVAQEALKKDPAHGEGQLALENALYVYRKDRGYPFDPLDTFSCKKTMEDVGDLDSKNRVFCAADEGGSFYFWDLSDRHLISVYESHITVSAATSGLYSRVILCGNSLAVIFNDFSLTGYDYRKGEVVWRLQEKQWTAENHIQASEQVSMCVNADRMKLYKADISNDGEVLIAEIGTETGKILRRMAVRFAEKESFALHNIGAVSLSADEKELAVGVNYEASNKERSSWLLRVDLADEDVVWSDHAEGQTVEAVVFDGKRLIAVFAFRSILPDVLLAESEPYTIRCYLPSGKTAWSQSGYYVDRGRCFLIDITDHADETPRKVISVVISTQALSFSENGDLLSMHTYGDVIAGYSSGTKEAVYIITGDGIGRKVLKRESTETDGIENSNLGLRVLAAFYDKEEKEWLIIPENGKKTYVYGRGKDPDIETVDFLPGIRKAVFSENGRYCLIEETQNLQGRSAVSLWDMEERKKLWSEDSAAKTGRVSCFAFTDEYMYCGIGDTFYLYSLIERTLTGTWKAPENPLDPAQSFNKAAFWKDGQGEVHVFIEKTYLGWVHLKGKDLKEEQSWTLDEWNELCDQKAEEAKIDLPAERYASIEGRYLIYKDSVSSERPPDASCLCVLDLETLSFVAIPAIPVENLLGESNLYSLSEDGSMLVINGRDHVLHLIALPDGKEKGTVDLKDKRALSFTLNPKKDQLLVQTDDYLLLCCNISSGTEKVCMRTSKMRVSEWRFTGPDTFLMYHVSGMFISGYYRCRQEEDNIYSPVSYLASCRWVTDKYGYFTDTDGFLCRVPIRTLDELLTMSERYLEGKTFTELELKQYGIE